MAETMNGLKRTSYCGRLSKANVGKEEIVCGWVQKQRDKGHLIFIDLRDRTGVVQLVFDDDTDREVFEKAASVHSEYVLIARGLVRQREAVNTEISTGEIEIHVEELRILSKAQTPPFEITDKSKVKEELRLKYRYLDLRRKPLQEKMILRHQIAKVTRDYFYENDFWRSRPRCSSSPLQKARATTWFRPESITASSTPCRSPRRSISSC